MDDVYFLFLCAKNLYNDKFVHVFTFNKLNELLLENIATCMPNKTKASFCKDKID